MTAGNKPMAPVHRAQLLVIHFLERWTSRQEWVLDYNLHRWSFSGVREELVEGTGDEGCY